MTVSYARHVATSTTGYSVFLKLLFRWKGSVYKLIWADVVIYLLLYYSLNCVYRFGLSESQRAIFEVVVGYCSTNISQVPLSFVLGFYVSLVMSRWWDQFNTIPYPDNLAILISAGVKGNAEHCRIIRRTLGRYACLSFATTLSLISPKVKKRFPTLQHFVDAGLMMPDEMKIMAGLGEEYPNYPQFWLPLAWASNIASRARQEGLIRTDIALSGILQEIIAFRTRCGGLLNYDWVNIPLVYTQVITIAVYTYFLTSVIGRQLLGSNEQMYFPFLAVLEFFFYMGWVRVAETLINPFGEDDDDFDVVWLIDRHVQVTYLIVDKIHEDYPKLMQDQYWHSLVPKQLPFTVASEKYREDCPQSSTEKMNITEVDAEVTPAPEFQRSKDGSVLRKRQTSLLKRLFSVKGSQPPNLKDMSLSSIVTDETPLQGVRKFQQNDTSKPKSMDTVDVAPNTSSHSTNSEGGDVEGELIDFDKLKKLRQLLTKQKVVKYMELLKEHSDAQEDQILDDIMNTPSEVKDNKTNL